MLDSVFSLFIFFIFLWLIILKVLYFRLGITNLKLCFLGTSFKKKSFKSRTCCEEGCEVYLNFLDSWYVTTSKPFLSIVSIWPSLWYEILDFLLAGLESWLLLGIHATWRRGHAPTRCTSADWKGFWFLFKFQREVHRSSTHSIWLRLGLACL